MPAKRLSMRQIKELLRLKHSLLLGRNQIAASLGVAASTVGEYLRRTEEAGLSWPLPEGLDDAELERRLFPPPLPASHGRTLPDWVAIDRELRRKSVTLMLLWSEYKSQHPDGYNYSRFCDLYRRWRGTIDLVMRQEHKAGHKLFVDYAGQTVDIVEPLSGEIRQAQIFVAVLGASNYTYAEATATQTLRDWIASHQRAFAFYGGVPELVVPDNLRSGVTSAHRYDPEINRSYAEMAEHYGVAVLPARVRKPRDKAKAEAGVLLVERWILAALRDHTFLSLEELNDTIAELVARLNDRRFQKLPGSRRSTFEQIERPALAPLPEHRYTFAEWKKARVNIDYHVEVDGHYYSVPYTHARTQLDVRLTDDTVECFTRNERVAAHRRSPHKGRHTTITEHMPRNHRQHAEFTPERLIAWARHTGEATAELVERIIAERAHPEQGYRTCLGVMRLGKAYGADRLEAAARRALAIGTTRYRSIESILKKGLDREPLPDTPHDDAASARVITHENVRGAQYYAMTEAAVSGGAIPC